AQSAEGNYQLVLGPDIHDLSGNALTTAYTATFTIDRTGPRITSATPNSLLTPLSSITVNFDSGINAATLDSGDVQLSGPSGAVGISSITPLSATSYRLSFARQNTGGTYSLSIGPNIADAAGNAMDQDQDGINGEIHDDVFMTSFNVADSYADLIV